MHPWAQAVLRPVSVRQEDPAAAVAFSPAPRHACQAQTDRHTDWGTDPGSRFVEPVVRSETWSREIREIPRCKYKHASHEPVIIVACGYRARFFSVRKLVPLLFLHREG